MVRGPPLAGPVKRAWQRSRSYLRLVLGVAAAVVLFWALRPHSGPTEGDALKDLDLPWVSGATGRLETNDLLGSVTVIEAFAGWCGTCKRTTPHLNSAASAKRQHPMRLVGISLDSSLEEARTTASAWNLAFPVALADKKFQHDFQINVLPTLIVVDSHGIVRHARAGAIDRTTLEGWLTELGAGLQ